MGRWLDSIKEIGNLLFGLFAISILFSLPTFAGTNQNLVYQGRVVRPDGTVVNSGSLTFSLSLYSPSPAKCLLYSEIQSVSMSESQGMFSLSLGAGARIDGGSHSLSQAFVNGSTLGGLTCANGDVSYTAGPTDDRSLEVSFTDNGTTVRLSALSVKSVPFALQAHEIDGWGLNNLVKVSALGSPTTFTPTEMANVKTVGAAACATNEILKWNGSAWMCGTDVSAGSPADASYAAKGVFQADTDAATSGLAFSSSGVLKVNAGTGANQIVKLDGSSKLPSVDGSQITNLSLSQITAGTLPISRGGTGATTKTAAFDALSPNSAKGDLTVFNGTNNVSLPVGSNGQVLTADSAQATGVKWANVSTGSVTSVTAGTGLTGGAITSTGTLGVNVGTGANQIVQLDGSSRLPAVDGSQLSNISFSQISSGTLPVPKGGTGVGSFLANKIVGTDGTGSSLTSFSCASGEVIKFNGSGAAVCGTDNGGTGSEFLNGGNSFGANATLGTNDNYTLGLKTNNTTRMTIDATGKVGIGTTGPGAPLEVFADGGATARTGGGIILSRVSIPGAYRGGAIYSRSSDDGNTDNLVFGVTTNNGLNPHSDYGEARMVINSSNRVGIATTHPVSTLDVNGGVSVGSYAGSNTSPANGLIVSGNVGVGTASPGAALDVKGTFRLSGATSGYVGLAPAANAGSTTYTLPAADGSAGSILSTNGSGGLSWVANSSGGMTSVTAGTGLLVGATAGASITSTGTLNIDVGTGANQIVQLDASSKLPALDGSQLTNFSVGQITSGTLPISRGGTGQVTKTAAFDALSPNTTKGDFIVFDGTNNIRLPRGSDGQVLTTDSAQTAGVKWADAAAGTLTNVTAGKGLNVGAGPGGSITSAGTLNIDTGTGANQIVQLTAASKLPAVDGSLLTNLDAGQITTGTLPVSKGGTGVASFAANNLIGTNGTGTTLQAVTCSQNQVLSFDASGNYGCYSLSSLAGGTYFANGGNSFGAAATLGTNDNYALGFKTNNTTRMTIDTTGNVGIGTTGPGSTLDIYQPGSSTTSLALRNSVMGFSMTTGASNFSLGSTGAVDVAFKTDASERMRITSTGNVGIGTTSPSTLLSLYSADPIIGVATTDGADDKSLTMSAGGGRSGSRGGYIWLGGNEHIGDGLPFDYGSIAINAGLGDGASNYGVISLRTNGLERVRIDGATGNVGIGTTAPISTTGLSLHLSNSLNDGTVNSNANIVVESKNRAAYFTMVAPTSMVSGLNFRNTDASTTTGQGQIKYDHSTKIMTFATDNTNRLAIDSTGNVGIGTSSPSSKLQVSGAIASAAFTANATDSSSALILDYSQGNLALVSTTGGNGNVILSKMVVGGAYTVIIQDGTARTYDFTNGGSGSQCATGTTRYLPANAATSSGKHSVYSIVYAGTGLCYITWSSGF